MVWCWLTCVLVALVVALFGWFCLIAYGCWCLMVLWFVPLVFVVLCVFGVFTFDFVLVLLSVVLI